MSEAYQDSFGGRIGRMRHLLVARARAAGIRVGLVGYRPPVAPSVEGWGELYASGYYDYLGGLGELARYSLLDGYIRHLGGSPSILDLGCGSGILRERIAGAAFARYVGVDPAAAAIETAKRLEDDRTSFRVGDPDDLDLEPFDIVVANEVFYGVAEPSKLVGRAFELLRPGGHLLSSNFRHPGDRGLHRMLDERFELLDAVEARNLTGPGRRKRRWRVTCHRRPGEAAR